MTRPVDPEVEKAHTDVLNLFRRSTAGEPAAHASVCRAARDRLAALPVLDPDDPSTWAAYALVTADVQTLLAYLRETGVPSSEPERFRSLVIRVLRYLYRADRAEPGALLAELVRKDWETSIGESHDHTLVAAERLAACLHARGDSEQARPVFERVLRLRSERHGEDHPGTLLAACNMGACLNELRDHRGAFRLNTDTVRRCERRLGKDDPTTILATENLAGSLFGLGELGMALTLYRDVQRRHARVSGENSLAALEAQAGIAITLHELGDHEAARAVNAALLPRIERAAGKEYSGTRNTRTRLERNLRALGRDKEADEVHGGIPNFLPPP
ncbi:tetratricopeptide repeat protein [Streptomyces marokkonensis]|uniref:tetratricopeptide repeat protein n=1 Tax=Streptomyces marokkonensis TaxID=324855 RepID=UPI0011F36CCC|nr:tetratricopeptide repeat protein [Streptomyces marokkonensis]